MTICVSMMDWPPPTCFPLLLTAACSSISEVSLRCLEGLPAPSRFSLVVTPIVRRHPHDKAREYGVKGRLHNVMDRSLLLVPVLVQLHNMFDKLVLHPRIKDKAFQDGIVWQQLFVIHTCGGN